MSDNFTFSSAGQVHELELAMQRAGGWTPALVKKMCVGDFMSQVRDMVVGRVEIVPVERLVDLDADPFLPSGWVGVECHMKGGKVIIERRGEDLFVNGRRVGLHLSRCQMIDMVDEGHLLREYLSNKDVLNANVLDYLLVHPRLVPEKWQGKKVFFWGTIYRSPDNLLYVRCLIWHGNMFDSDHNRLSYMFSSCAPAAVLASLPKEAVV